ncbi:MAG: UbiA prenyltransferase family protein [Thermoplasmata archaeon]|nr:MAG: UbiA prenyltransferase family protein [Thermoplasmata archaeon]
MSVIDAIQASFQTFRRYFKQMAPLFWGVSILPYYMGWSLASNKIYPTYVARILLLPDPAPAQNMFLELFIFLGGIIAIGPLLGGATILYNDFFDRGIDKPSRRKKHLPLLKGMLKPRSIYRLSIALFSLAFLLALFISIWFALLVLACIILSIIYSSPPLRLKEHPGFDLLTNAIASGIICTMAGWIIIRPVLEFPILWGIVSFFGVGAIYLPTTIIDFEPDVKKGVKTIATYLGKRRAFYLGWSFVVLANSTIILMGLLNYIIPPRFLLFVWPIMIAEILSYWYYLRKLDFKGGYYAILVFSLLVAFGTGLILFYNAGLLIIP